MRYLVCLVLLVLLGSCARANRAVIYRHENWNKLSEKRPVITVELDRPGIVKYKEAKDGSYEVELDGKTPGLLEGAIKQIEVNQ